MSPCLVVDNPSALGVGGGHGDRQAGAYTRPLFCSTSAVSVKKYTLHTP